MSKTIEEVLTADEIKMLEQLQADMENISLGVILENVRHIECNASADRVNVALYTSLINPYERMVHNLHQKPAKLTEENLRDTRTRYLNVSRKRQEILKNELSIRTYDIKIHKWYLSEKTERDTGIIIASAHWLKDISALFYAQSREHHLGEGVEFEWMGMEKAVVIAAPNRAGENKIYVLVNKNDLLFEENLAQGTGGIVKSNPQETYKMAIAAREKLIEMHETQHFCILGSGTG